MREVLGLIPGLVKSDTVANGSPPLRRFCVGQALAGERPGQQFWPGFGFIRCFILCLEYLAKLATCVLTPHVNAVNGIK